MYVENKLFRRWAVIELLRKVLILRREENDLTTMYIHYIDIHPTIVATDGKEQCRPPCKASTSQGVSPTPWLVYSSLKTRGALPPWLSDWGSSCPPSPPGSYASASTILYPYRNVWPEAVFIVVLQELQCVYM